ncbi:MAG: hypothetical protein O7A98_05310 [Acidobacteria bacterium]|nr:hypothetical protein [Acidobacteriota bacterium]
MKGVVAFATLFLGLTVGPHRVELLVGRDVAAVEIRLDGRTIARLEGAPWEGDCDLGVELEPRSLEAIAYAADGTELGRTSQWLNIPRPPAQAEILFDTDPATGRVVARLRSTSITSESPEQVTVFFDGVELPADDPQRIALPAHDPQQLHYLRVDLEFAKGLVSTVERTFGGSFVDEVAAELTAVPLQLAPDANELSPGAIGWLHARGEQLAVVDVVTGPADIILIRDQSAQPDIDLMVKRRFGDYRVVASLKRGYSLQFLRPVAEISQRADTHLRLFRPSPLLTPHDGGVFWLLTAIRAPKVPPRMQRLSDAVAVAALAASSAGHRRAVVLLLGPDPADFSQFTPDGVRHYLETMRVPLVVWSTTGARDTPWGVAADASSMHKLERQTRRLVKSLERQRIAWVRGVYLPPEITLATGSPAVRFTGS